VAEHREDVAARERADEAAVVGGRDDGQLVELAVLEACEDAADGLSSAAGESARRRRGR
jgi:hypothetical protein